MLWHTSRMSEVFTYNGRRYHRYPDSKHAHLRSYFQHTGKRRGFLHRHIWEDVNGPIPEGYEIHHRDENTLNNDLQNLELVTRAWHRKFHMSKRVKTDEHLALLDRIRPLTKAWHASPSGLEKHREIGLNSWVGRETTDNVCICCGKTYETHFPTRSKFCGHNCSTRYRRRGSDADYGV